MCHVQMLYVLLSLLNKHTGHSPGKELFIFVMVANPEPRDGIAVENTNRTVTVCDSHRPNILLAINTLKM